MSVLLNDALSAYLTPLLEKHTAGEAIIYDDLIHSWQASSSLMSKNFDPSVSKHMRELHESQLKAYEDAARAALTEQAQSVALPASIDEEDANVEQLLGDIAKPDWKVNEVVWEQAWMTPLRERVSALSSENDEDDEEVAVVEMDQEGEVEDEEESVEKPKVTVKKPTVKKRAVATKAGKGLLKKKALGAGAGAKPGAGTPGQRAVRGRRARRGGRGGGGAGAAK